MALGQPNRLLDHLRRTALVGAGPTDAELLDCFLARRDEAAFGALVRRHGPMVLGVCRRILRNEADSEDAFQAVFLVLVRRAASMRTKALVGNFLYGVAFNTARKLRAMNSKRRTKERQAAQPDIVEPAADDRLLELLDEELHRLPENYRVPIVLCDLEGKPIKEAARQLGWPQGTVASRLARGRVLLARRLRRQGLALSGGALAAVLAQETLSACLPPVLRHVTAKAAARVEASGLLAAGMVSAQVMTLTEGVLKIMLLNKLKAFWAMGLVLLIGAGAVGLTYRPAAAQSPQPKPQPAREAEPSRAARAPADDLEELRLEIAALRKGLEATRQRVKTLETEVQSLKGKRAAGGGGGGTAPPVNADGSGSVQGQGGQRQGGQRQGGQRQGGGVTAPPSNAEGGKIGDYLNRYDKGVSGPGQKADDPVAEAQSALKRIRANRNDKDALDALERALQQLKPKNREPANQAK
jgi:RNA polymerase sigma factor (sigma-70 family)